ncbi:hypothetical protein NDN08_001809 [Rhodosorus marinus]|uniref:Uncharacterized protein n=1 Tax=Rhodosorus marinus TaxID=101924 RepID=A0AAV8UW75_9RHOD|nr:hypothetical protein NDN08_001809 [Rhodosorus marinus]
MEGSADTTWLVFDFDNTLIDENSDYFVFERLGSDILDTLRDRTRSVGFTQAVDECLAILWNRGISVHDLRKELGNISVNAKLAGALLQTRSVVSERCMIVSDANTEYIRTILKRNGLDDGVFERIVTNPSFLESDRLRVKPFDNNNGTCRRCPENLCKGRVIEDFREKRNELSASAAVKAAGLEPWIDRGLNQLPTDTAIAESVELDIQ